MKNTFFHRYAGPILLLCGIGAMVLIGCLAETVLP